MSLKNKGYWGLILGGSSGMGLASAKKLASQGMHICIVHRDRRSSMQAFNEEVAAIKAFGVKCLTFNLNALKEEERVKIIDELKSQITQGEGIKVILHSIAKGNLKTMGPGKTAAEWEQVQNAIGFDQQQMQFVKEQILHADDSDSEFILGEEDYMLTIQAMGVSYYSWIKDIFHSGLLAPDALALALTSEGNRKAWRHYAAVSAAKSTLESISRSMALELGSKGLRSNIIQAGVTDTFSLNMIPGSKVLKTNALLRNPLSRLTTPEDVANVVYLLCLPEANWINGAIIPVDGGESIT